VDRFYMACLDLRGRRCVVVGAGSVGLEKTRGLLDCGALVTVVAPLAEPELHELSVVWRPRRYRARDLEGAQLVVAATADPRVNRRVHADAESRGLLCNVADVPELCNFILPSVYRRDPIAVAVSTGGASPALAKRLRDQIAAQIGPEHAELAQRLRTLRPWAKKRFATYDERRVFFEQLVSAELP
jgi:precorrin-2 dehydrogenase/sirohydrochlorin ferrochelatase